MDTRPSPGPRRTRALLLAILGLALALRLAHWWAVRDEPFFGRLVLDSREYDRWAREIAAGRWLGSETFFQAPLYPYLLALLYLLFGRSPDGVYLAQIALAVAGCWALFRAGRAMAGEWLMPLRGTEADDSATLLLFSEQRDGERVGLAAAGLAAVYGPFVFYDVQVMKESLAVTATCFLLWALAAARERPGAVCWLAAGLLLGILALLRENALLMLPLLAMLALGRDAAGERRPGGLARAGALVLGAALALAPVAVRNRIVGGDLLPTTYQGGVNFYIGNNPQADGTYRPLTPGKQVPALERREPVRLAERAAGRRLSPAEVSGWWLRRALRWAAAHPGDFLRLQARKLAMFWSFYEWPDAVDYYWTRGLSPVLRLPLAELGTVALLAAAGLGLARGRLRRFLPAIVWAAGWMAATVAFFLFSRYRLPAVPALAVLAGVPVAAAAEAWHERRTGRAAALAALVLAAWALPRLLPYGPRLDLVHYNLARLEEEAGRPEEAAAHYRAALAANPEDFLSLMSLGNLAARRGDLDTALALYRRAAALEPGSDDVLSNLGGALLAKGEPAEARRHLERAVALNDENVAALHNLSVLLLREGDLGRARELNRRVLALQPDHPAALRLRARLAG